MLRKDVEKYKNRVVTLDLVSGAQVVVSIKDVTDDVVVIRNPIMFRVVPNPRNPQEVGLQPLPYGAPFYELEGEQNLELQHIMFVFEPSTDMANAYRQMTSGLTVASSVDLNNLPDLSKIVGKRD